MKDNVDKRVVEFEFDNSNFDKNVKKSKKTLKEFEETLEFKDVSKSLDQIKMKFSVFEVAVASAVKNIADRVTNISIRLVKSLSIDNLSAGWEKFGQKTIAVGTLMSQALKIAGREIDNYSEKMNVVNEQLDKLNWFTDQTSYNFTDMVDNIGKFTAAGQDLDKSVEAMMGIANWAALSGQNAVTASRAMYQLSQALGKGYVQLMDYKSIQNANMDTQEFRQTVLDTAVAMGELTKEGENFISKTGKKFTKNQFAEQLSSKWFTSDVLTKSLEKYSAAVDKLFEISTTTGKTASEVIEEYGDQFDDFAIKAFKAAQEARTFTDVINATKDAVGTGWMKTAEYIFGGYDEAKVFWTDLADALWEVFAAAGEVRNQILKVWTSLEGRADLFAHDPDNPEKQGAFWNIYDSIVALTDLVKTAWRTIFPKSQFEDEADQVNDLAHNFKSFTTSLQQSTARLRKYIKENKTFQKILEGIFSIVRLVVSAFETLRYALDPLIYATKEITQNLLGLIANIGDKLSQGTKYVEAFYNAATNVNEALTAMLSSFNLSDIIDGIVDSIEFVFILIKTVVSAVNNFFKEHIHLAEFLKNVGSAIKSLGNNIKSLFASFKNGYNSTNKISIFDAITGVKGKKKQKEKAEETIEEVKEETELFAVLKNFVEALGNLLKTIYPLFISVVKLATAVINDAVTLITAITGKLTGLAEKNKDIVQSLKNILAIAALLFVFAELVRIFINLRWIAGYLKVTVYAFLDEAATALSKWGTSRIIESIGKTLKDLAISLIIFYASFRLFKDSGITWKDIWPSLVVLSTVVSLMILLAVFGKKLNNSVSLVNKQFTATHESTALREISTILISLGLSFMAIAYGMTLIANIDKDKFWYAAGVIGAVTVCLVVMAVFGEKVNEEGKKLRSVIPSALQFLSFALVLKVAITGVSKIVDAISGSDKKWYELVGILAGVVVCIAALVLILRRSSRIITRGVGQGGYVFQFGSQVGGVLLGIAAVIYSIITLSNTIFALGASAVSVLKLVGIILGSIFAATLALYAAVGVYSVILNKKQVDMSKIFKNNPVVMVLLSLAAMMLAISASLWLISQVKWNKEIIGFLIGIGAFIVAILGVVVGLAAIMKDKRYESVLGTGKDKFSQKKESSMGTADSIANILKSVALLVLAFTASIAVLSTLDYIFGDDYIIKIGMMVGTFILSAIGMVALLMVAMKKMQDVIASNKQKSTMAKTIIAMIPVILAIGSIIGSIVILNKYGTANVAIITGSIIAALYGIIKILELINKLNIKNEKLMQFAKGMGLLVASITVLSGALIIMSIAIKKMNENIKIDAKSWEMFGFIAALLALFVGLGALIGAIPMIGVGMLFLGGIITVFLAGLGVAMQSLAWGLKPLIPQIDKLKADSIKNLAHLLLWLSLSGLTGILGILGNSSLGVGMFVLGWGLANLVAPMNLLTADGVANLAHLLLWLSLTGLTGILGVVGNSSLGTGMYVLGWGLDKLVTPMNLLTEDGVRNLKNLLLWMSLTGVTGVLAVVGNSSIAAGMAALGGGLSQLTPYMDNLTEDSVRSLKNLLLWMSLTGVTGLLAAVGNSSIGVGMAALGAGLAVLNPNLSNLDESKVKGLKKLLDVLSGGGNNENILQKLGNILTEVFGSVGTSASAVGMGALAAALGPLNNALDNISLDSVSALEKLLKLVSNEKNFSLSNSEKIKAAIKGNIAETFNILANSIKNLMAVMSNYNNQNNFLLLDYITRIIEMASNANNEFVIKPILDLSNVEQGYAEISSLMTSLNGNAMSVSSQMAAKAMEARNSGNTSSSNNSIVNNTSESYYVTFNITDADPVAIADALDAELQKRHNDATITRGGRV